MFTVKQAAEKLGVTDARVRAMVHDGVLQGSKFGRIWVISEAAVEQRLRVKPSAGRPRMISGIQETAPVTPPRDLEVAHRLFRECEETLAGCYNASFLNLAESETEQRFFLCVSDFFLREKQKELIAQGVY